MDVKLKVLKKGDNKEFQLLQIFTMGEADFNQFMQLRNHLVLATDKFVRKENLSTVLIPTSSKDMDD